MNRIVDWIKLNWCSEKYFKCKRCKKPKIRLYPKSSYKTDQFCGLCDDIFSGLT